MALSGRARESGQFVRFAPAGVLTSAPVEIDRVELSTCVRGWAFERTATGWRLVPDARPVAGPLATHLEDGLKFLHASGPIRVLERAEWSEQGLREFGLDPPAYTVRLFHDGRAVLAVAFGAENPQKVLQYMRVAGRDPILVMSRSLGRQWEQVLSEAAR